MIQDTTKSIYRRLGLKGFARVDYMVTSEGEPYLIEVNTTPGFSEASIVPQQIRAAGKEVTAVLTEIVDAAF
jgi:D-alanine-D-alanine ligase